jgi:hypothetical protein
METWVQIFFVGVVLLKMLAQRVELIRCPATKWTEILVVRVLVVAYVYTESVKTFCKRKDLSKII